MANYLVLAVAYSKEERHIEWLLVSREVDRKLGFLSVVGNEFVVDLIKSESATFRTATIDAEQHKYFPGAHLHIYDDVFLTTDPDSSESNNLENLPEFSMPDDEIDQAVMKSIPGLFKSE